MEGLSVLKDKPDPVAMADDKYPDWLWTILEEPVSASKKEGEFDFKSERKRLRTQWVKGCGAVSDVSQEPQQHPRYQLPQDHLMYDICIQHSIGHDSKPTYEFYNETYRGGLAGPSPGRACLGQKGRKACLEAGIQTSHEEIV